MNKPRIFVPAALISIVVLPAIAFAAAPAGRSATVSASTSYHENASRLIGSAIGSSQACDNLAWLCDHVGNRICGSPQLDQAIAWAADVMKKNGLKNVHTEPVQVPHWVRGSEKAWTTVPSRHDITMLGLGMSIGTPPGGIEADVVVATSFAQLDSLGEAGIKGKIVLYDVPFVSYGQTVAFRSSGPSRAARYGAVAALVRSVGPISYDTPHTGMLSYADDAPKIPAAAVTIEDATHMHRIIARGEPVRVHLEMEAQLLDPVASANVIGEIVGREKPEEVVVIGGHTDSWDVGQGAQDDGVGCVIAMEAARLIQNLGLKPRRTIRVVLFTNEENGVAGGRAYRDAHRSELANHVAAIESDSGNGPASGFELDVRPIGSKTDSLRTAAQARAARDGAQSRFREIASLLQPLEASRIVIGGSGADIGPMVSEGVTGLGLNHETGHYFEVHHTRADTFDKIDCPDLARNVAIMAVAAYLLADMPERLVQPEAQAVVPSGQ